MTLTYRQGDGWTKSEHSTEKKWHPNGNGDSGLNDVVVDALIAWGSAMLSVFIALPGVPDAEKVWAGVVAFGVTFFASLTAARKRPKRRRKRGDAT